MPKQRQWSQFLCSTRHTKTRKLSASRGLRLLTPTHYYIPDPLNVTGKGQNDVQLLQWTISIYVTSGWRSHDQLGWRSCRALPSVHASRRLFADGAVKLIPVAQDVVLQVRVAVKKFEHDLTWICELCKSYSTICWRIASDSSGSSSTSPIICVDDNRQNRDSRAWRSSDYAIFQIIWHFSYKYYKYRIISHIFIKMPKNRIILQTLQKEKCCRKYDRFCRRTHPLNILPQMTLYCCTVTGVSEQSEWAEV